MSPLLLVLTHSVPFRFINPANKWTIQSTGAQSKLLLSDRMILYAVIALNDGNGKILRRRLLALTPSSSSSSSFSTLAEIPMNSDGNNMGSKGIDIIGNRIRTALANNNNINGRRLLQQTSSTVTTPISTISEQQVAAMLQKIAQTPRTGVMPPIDYHVDVPYTLASIYGVENRFYLLLSVSAVGKFDPSATQQQVNDEFMRRIMANQAVVCKECSGIYPAFSNMQQVQQLPATAAGSRRRRNLLQTSSSGTSRFQGEVSILLVYDSAPLNDNGYSIYFADVSKSVLAPTFTNIWSGSSDGASLQAFIDNMVSNQFVVTEIKSSSGQTTGITIDMSKSGIIVRTPAPTPAPTPSSPSLSPTPPPPTPPGYQYAMDMTVFGINDRSKQIPGDGQYTSYKDRTSDAASRTFDPMIATIFLAASLLLFWGENV